MAKSLQHAVPLAWEMKPPVFFVVTCVHLWKLNLDVYQHKNQVHTEQNLSPLGIYCMPHSQHPSFLCLPSLNFTMSGRKNIRGIRCSLGFQIMNLARPPESRESPTLTFSLVRHWPEQCFSKSSWTQSMGAHPFWHPLRPIWSLRPNKSSSPSLLL